MNRLLCAALALCLAASSADARALVIRNRGYTAGTEAGIQALMGVTLPMLNTLGGDYRVVNIEDARQGATDALRRGAWYNGPISATGDSALYNPIIIVGDDRSSYTQGTFTGDIGRESSVNGYGKLHSAGLSFAYWKPGFLVTGTGITGVAVVVGVDSGGGVARLAGTIAGSTTVTDVTWRLGLRPDSLTRTVTYPRVTFIRIGNSAQTASFSTSANCSSGVASQIAYSAAAGHDSIWNVYEIGNNYRSWKSRVHVAANATRDTRGWRPLLGAHTTRQTWTTPGGIPGYRGGNYDFPDPVCGVACAYSNNPDSVAAWAVMNWGADGTPIGGDAKPNVYCFSSAGTVVEPGILLATLAWGDSLSGGGLFGNSQKLPRKFAIHIDDAWRRGDSKYGTAVGLISVDDTTAYKASIDSLASLQVPLVVSYEPESLATVLLSGPSPYVTGDGRYYDQRWWARNPYAHYTPHCHSGAGTNFNSKIQNTGIGTNGFTGKNIRVLDIFGVSRQRYAFGSVDSLLAYGLPDYVNDPADTGSVYWMVKRAFALGDSVFGRDKVDRLIMPAGDDWSINNVKHSRTEQNALGVDSTIAALLAAGAVGTRTNGNNVVGSDSVTLGHNNYGYYPGWKRVALSHQSGGPGMPTWLPSSMYGRTFEILPTNGYPSGSQVSALVNSASSWSHNRNSFGGDSFLRGLLCERAEITGDPGSQRAIFILTSHTGDYGSSGWTGEETRPQFYTTKYVMNQIRVANAHARRELVQCVYPQELRP